MLAVAKSGHLDSSLSSTDIVTALYNRVLRHDPANPGWPERDRFVLSKGHAAPILYAALARHAYFPLEDLMGLRKIGAQLQGHPDMNKTAGVEVSTGSLGQGLSMSLGIALAMQLDGLEDQRVFALLSDGDCQEGQTWEAATAAPHFADRGGHRLTAIVDYNHLQTDGTTEEVMDIADMRAKFSAFGWSTVEIDGHDMTAIVDALEDTRGSDKPCAIVAQTKKGRGVSTMEGRFGFHGKPPTPEQADEALTELEALYKEQTAALGAATADFEKLPAPDDSNDDGERSDGRCSRGNRTATPTATRWSSLAASIPRWWRSMRTSRYPPRPPSSATSSRSASSMSEPPRRT